MSREHRPTVSIVFLVYNRREDLSVSLEQMLRPAESAGPGEVIVVDNASTDGTAAMIRSRFPSVTLIERETNCGVSGFNDGFAVAAGDYVLALDDDCYLPDGALAEAVDQAESVGADLVSFGVASSFDEAHRFDIDQYPTGLMTFWGCAVLIRRQVIAALRGYVRVRSL